jgi:hypothetical protein
VPFPRWVPSQVRQQAATLSVAEAERLLSTTGLFRGEP